MSDYERHVAAAVQATAFDARGAFTWFGRRYAPVPERLRGTLSPDRARDMLVGSLQRVLYQNFYGRGFAAPASEQSVISAPGHPGTFVDALVAANAGSGYWQQGWERLDQRDDGTILSRRGLTVRVHSKDLQPSTPASEASSEASIEGRWSVLQTKGSTNLSPGYYMAFGNVEMAEGEELLRIYWNLSPSGGVALMRQVTSRLNRLLVPFALKILQDPAGFDRCDAGVLYVRRRDYPAVADGLERIYPAVRPGLKPGTPVFTKPIAAGVGLAEDPGAGASFGLHRCRLLADAMLCAHEERRRLLADRLRFVSDSFAAAGVTLEQPYLNPSSADVYAPLRAGTRSRARRAPSAAPAGGAQRGPLQVAEQIGEQLCQRAIWSGDRCTWLGPELSSGGRTPAALTWAWKPAGADLYTGTSGVAIFLAELYAATGEDGARATALGAMRRALAGLESVPAQSRLGLFSGWPGIALAAMRVGGILGDSTLCEAAFGVLCRCKSEARASAEFDLLAGRAGSVVALLVLSSAPQGISFLEFATELGDDLLRSATRLGPGYAWQSVSLPRQPPLTGFSHGTAGVGYALMELHLATGDGRYRQGAERAFDYERELFDAETKNWPDLRHVPRRRRRGPLPCMTAWCHGAPGIGLSRLRAFQITEVDRYRAEAVTALETTRGAVETALLHGPGDFSLCHGLAGNADVLLHGERMLSHGKSDTLETVMAVAELGRESYASRGRPWPCGAGPGEAPGLMLGLAGIGYFYLRLHDATVPSLLLPRGVGAYEPGD